MAAATRSAEFDPYSPATETPPNSASAVSTASRVPDPTSRTSSGVAASASAVIGSVHEAANDGAAAIISRSRPMTAVGNPLGRDTDSTSPRSQRSARTSATTAAEFSTPSPTSTSGCAEVKVARYPGSRYSATVREAHTRTVPARASRIAWVPALRAR